MQRRLLRIAIVLILLALIWRILINGTEEPASGA